MIAHTPENLTFTAKLLLIVIHDNPALDIDRLIGSDPDGLTAIAELAEKGMLQPAPEA